jgi:copper chaperone CopZ
MKSLHKIVMAILVLLSGISNAQIKNAKTETVKIFGNCGMCETKIEKVGSIKNIAKVDWDMDSKIATLTYDESKTNQDEILKRIALAGYDSEKFLAPDTAYANLPGCCQYDREAKVPVKDETKVEEAKTETTNTVAIETNQLQAVYDNYFLLKDALVKTDSKAAAAKANELLSAIQLVKMESLKMEVHMVWMKVLKGLSSDAKSISESQDIKKQRDFFKSLSKNTYELIKISKPTEAVYYQYCPMQDANWLSKENAVKNPYYGAQMLTCGKVVESIK